ncbi:MAG: class I SAM-dependent methyltransferase family protein [Candidatus Micrarchaeaceae archaeon]|jgi:tRNA (guanine37-N1)-methyltransferase
MNYLKIKLEHANEVKKLMMHLNIFDSSRTVQHSRSYVYFPIIVMNGKDIKPFDKFGAKIIKRNLRKNSKRPSYEEELVKSLSANELKKLSKGYDQLGDIAIIEFKGSRAKEKAIAKILMKSNSTIKTVLAKDGAVSGKYRVRKLRYVAGLKNYIANYRENNCTFKFDVRKVFFSNRLSFERSRLLKLVKEKENVMVMFAGVGPFAIEIAKSKKNSKVIGIEANPHGYRSMLENIKINKTPNATAILGDVKKVSNKFKNFADRIIMPLPWSSLDFLDDVYTIAKKNAIVHIYAFTDAENAYESVFKRIKEHSKLRNYKIILLDKRLVRPYSKKELEIVLDYRMVKQKLSVKHI